MKNRMLVIDDDQGVLDACHSIFSNIGWDVDLADDPESGLKMGEEHEYQVILCDWKMPGLNGFDVLAKLDRLTPDAAVLMFSGYPSVDRATDAMKLGAMDFVPKPFTPDELIRAVTQAMDRKLSARQKIQGQVERLFTQFPTPSLDDNAPKTIAHTVAHTVGVVKTTSPWLSVTVLGILAGAYIGFGAFFSMSVTFDMGPILGVGFKKLVAGAAFSIGLMMVVIAGAELYTGNSLMISSVVTGKVTWQRMSARWGVVFLTNFLGSVLLALLFYGSGLWKVSGSALGDAAVATAAAKVNLGWWEAFIRAIGCNWMVCLAVWMAMASRQVIGKLFAILFPIMGFVAIGFEHCVANMFFIPAGIFLHQWAGISPAGAQLAHLTWTGFLVNNLVPVTIGNTIGGVVFVGLGYWGAYLRPSK